MKNEVTTTQKAIAAANRKQAMKKTMSKVLISSFSIAMLANSMMLTAFAANNENSNTSVTNTTTMTSMMNLVFWAVRIMVILAGGIPGLMKIVQGQADENPRDRNAGLATIGITGVIFAATFVVQGLI